MSSPKPPKRTKATAAPLAVENLLRKVLETGARELSLRGKDLSTLPDSIGRLTQLESLDLSFNQLTTLPDSIGRLTQLESLDLSFNQLTTLPDSIGQLAQLESLYLSGNQLTTLPDSIGQLTRLESLDLSGNPLTTLPDSIGQLTWLKRLYLVGNQLTTLPDSMGQLAQLEDLELSSNLLISFLDSIGQLTGLETLFLRAGELTTLPDSIGQLTWLKSLYLSGDPLTALPNSIGQLTQLVNLGVSSTQLTTLPDAIGQLTQLKSLSLSNNQLTTLPNSIGQLTRLETFDLSTNQLATLPDAIGQLTRLEDLDLSHNQLTELPRCLSNLQKLKAISLHGNEALNVPSEVLGPNRTEVKPGMSATKASDILDYYFRLREGARPLNEAKLILVGRGEVGKTSLIEKLLHDRFNPNEGKTKGINITEWKISLRETEEVRLNIWDFGGQEIMHATHQFFLTERSVYLLVLNGREGGEDADAEYWLKLIDSFGGGSPVIVVLNKIKMHPFDLNRRGLQRKYPVRSFVKTDCSDGTGIEDLRRAIKTEADRLEDLRKAFPASWFAIKEYLAGMKEKFLTFAEYRRLCSKLGENDEAGQERLAGYLHTLGIVLNYKDDPRLRDTHVLSPQWVTNGIYRIINAEMLERQKGELRLEDISSILNRRVYPRAMHRFLLDLMRKFDLGFSYPEDDTCYLIPELLDKEEPPETADFNRRKCLNFEYHYSVLPEGLLPRFMVRTHVLSAGQPRWRSGVVLQFEGNRALVRADAQDRRVFVSVSGPRPGRRRLLAIIRSDFEHIHRLIPSLEPEEMVPLPDYPDKVVAYRNLVVREKAGSRKFTYVIGEEVVELDVQELLDGVDIGGAQRREKPVTEEKRAILLFYSYSHKDERLREELETHLKLLQRQGWIKTWSDRTIEAGDEWKTRIDDELEQADVILLLVSADFIASDYCYEKEMKRALERHDSGEARVVPVILRDVTWKQAPFAKLQALPKDGLAITKWGDKDSAWRNVSEGIEKVIEELRSRQRL